MGIFTNTPDLVNLSRYIMSILAVGYIAVAVTQSLSGVMRGAGKVNAPMFIMLACWCIIRVSYITVAVKFVNKLTTVSWAYPITWTLSSIIFLVYFLKADWLHNFDKIPQKA